MPWSRHKMAATMQTTFPISFSCMELVVFWFNFWRNMFPWFHYFISIRSDSVFVQAMAWHWIGGRQLSLVYYVSLGLEGIKETNLAQGSIYMWVRPRNCGCLVTWFCYQLIAKPGNKTVAYSWPDLYAAEHTIISPSPGPTPDQSKASTTLVTKFEKHPRFADFGRKKHPFFNRNRWFWDPINKLINE